MSSASPTTAARSPGSATLVVLQRIGRSLMLPIAVLPAAALLLRFGANDMLGGKEGTVAEGMPAGLAQFSALEWLQPVAEVLGAAGGALFGNLPIIFALGVSIGFARRSDGSTALAGVVGYLVFEGVTEAMSPHILDEGEVVDFGVLGGILMGVVAALFWQRYHRIKLPTYLAFFGGRRFVPIITAFTAVIIGVVMSFVYRPFAAVLSSFSESVTGNDVVGGGLYGFVNRLLIPLGLHHIPNNILWFQTGEYAPPGGEAVHGDLSRFFAGDPAAGVFMTGFFPIMMFALPAAALAIWQTARPRQKTIVGGIMLSAALTSFLTGVTEPLEFSFLFVAYPLYFIHAVLTGTSLALTNAIGIRDGFGFSAGAIDYVLNFRIAEMPLLLLLIGLGYAAIYYFLFRWVIIKWNLRTPGREEEDEAIEASLGTEAAEIVSGGPRTAGAASAGRADDDLPPIIDQPMGESEDRSSGSGGRD